MFLYLHHNFESKFEWCAKGKAKQSGEIFSPSLSVERPDPNNVDVDEVGIGEKRRAKAAMAAAERRRQSDRRYQKRLFPKCRTTGAVEPTAATADDSAVGFTPRVYVDSSQCLQRGNVESETLKRGIVCHFSFCVERNNIFTFDPAPYLHA